MGIATWFSSNRDKALWSKSKTLVSSTKVLVVTLEGEGVGADPAFGGVDVIGVGWFFQTYLTHHVLCVNWNVLVNTALWSFSDGLLAFVAVPPSILRSILP